jgi:tetratricopeptide (TPR) repeat protein
MGARTTLGALLLLLAARPEPAAAATLAPDLAGSPNDYALWMAYGQAQLRSGAFDEAARAYRRAVAISEGAPQAQLGLAEALLGQGNSAEARELLEPLAANLDDATARKDLAALGPPWRLTFSSALSTQVLDAGPFSPSYGLSLGLEAALGDRWLVGARYRHLGSILLPLGGPPGPPTSTSAEAAPSGQDEGYLSLGYATPTFGLAGHLATVGFHGSAQGEAAGHSGLMAGLSGRYTLWADLLASATWSAYDDLGVFQGELGVRLPLLSWLSLYAGGRLQAAAGAVHPSALGELRLQSGPWGAALGGGYGDQVRPVDLATDTLYDTSYTLRWRAYARQSLSLGRGIALSLTYEYERYRLDSATDDTAEAGCHRLTAGLSLSF